MSATYRAAEGGVEKIEAQSSTFIPDDLRHPAWRSFQRWRAAGNQVLPSQNRPAFSDPCAPTREKIRQPLWIVGAGSYGREICDVLRARWNADCTWEVQGFLNDITNSLDNFTGYPPILHTTDYQPAETDLFICAIGDVAGRRVVCRKLQLRGAQFFSLISPSAQISTAAIFGEGVIVEAFSGIGTGTRIGAFSTILSHASIGHDVEIGEFAQIAPFASLLGGARIGAGSMIGSHAVILPHVEIGCDATVGAGSVVLRDVPAGTTVFGVPARPIS